MVRIGILLIAATATACLGELESSQRVSRTRILAIQAEPPTMMLGATTRLRALVATPPGEEVAETALRWLDCGGETRPDESRDLCQENPERSLGTGFEVDYQLPENLDPSLVAEQSFTGGYWQRVSLQVAGAGENFDRAFKRVVVQLPAPGPVPPAEAPNQNPNMVEPVVEILKKNSDEVEAVLGPDEALKPDLRYRFSFDFPLEDHEAFIRRYVDLSGLDLAKVDDLSEEDWLQRLRQEETFESLRMRAYSTDGRIGETQLGTTKNEGVEPGERSYYPFHWQFSIPLTEGFEETPRAEPLPAEIRLWFIVYDGRGGIDWLAWSRALEP
ncbi:MAG: hypothetical protein CMH55_05085 [Myxococcales bacterium]|nr:hypothetical protein [Myxococcales bacterium]